MRSLCIWGLAGLLLAGCSSASSPFSPKTPVKEHAPLEADQAAEVARAAEEAAAKTADVFDLSLRRNHDGPGDAQRIGFCLTDLQVDHADFCGESYGAHVLVAWDACPLWGGGRSSGTIDIFNELSTEPAGTACDAATAYSLVHDSTYDFLAELGNGSVHETHVAVSTASSQHFEGPPPMYVEADVAVDVDGTDAGGGPIYGVHVTGSYATEWDETTLPSTRIVNGHTNVHLDRLGDDYDVNAVDLVYPGDCCHPTSGTVDVSIIRGPVQYDGRVEFGPACGQAVVDGEPVELAPCTLLN